MGIYRPVPTSLAGWIATNCRARRAPGRGGSNVATRALDIAKSSRSFRPPVLWLSGFDRLDAMVGGLICARVWPFGRATLRRRTAADTADIRLAYTFSIGASVAGTAPATTTATCQRRIGDDRGQRQKDQKIEFRGSHCAPKNNATGSSGAQLCGNVARLPREKVAFSLRPFGT